MKRRLAIYLNLLCEMSWKLGEEVKYNCVLLAWLDYGTFAVAIELWFTVLGAIGVYFRAILNDPLHIHSRRANVFNFDFFETYAIDLCFKL